MVSHLPEVNMAIDSVRLRHWSYILALVIVSLTACAIFGQRKVSERRVIFSHKVHATEELDCEVCHQEIFSSTRFMDNNLPEEEICQVCHEESEIVYNKAAATIPPVEYGMKFSHKVHLEEGHKCIRCHESIPSSSIASDRNLPSMKICSECHEIEPLECSLCHFNLGSGEYVPASHDKAMWTIWHKNQAERNDDLCSDCHRGDVKLQLDQDMIPEPGHSLDQKIEECSKCHMGDIRPNRHGNNYVLNHGVNAKINSQRCNVCHKRAECIDCHEAVDFETRIHPAGWVNMGHIAPARNNLSTCVDCHDEQTCMVCHFEISPHPADWKSRLSFGYSRQHRDSSACMKCHEREELCTKCHGLRHD
ncbi:hypothetical protein GF312_10720 [Candidatus Poribacteria bacterium]|nr:hypothetical protein [Candidatus Poribacteria bacterium]